METREEKGNAFGHTERMMSEGQWLEMPVQVQWPRSTDLHPLIRGVGLTEPSCTTRLGNGAGTK